MIVGVMTENGVQNSSPIVCAISAQNDLCDVLKKIIFLRLNN